MDDRGPREELLAMTQNELERVLGSDDDRVRRPSGVFLPQVRGHGVAVSLPAEVRHVEKLGEDLHVSIRRFRERLAQSALQFDVRRQQPGIRKDDENVPGLLGRRGRRRA